MQVPISARLLCCAKMIAPGARVADIGTDHGYLPVYLLRAGRAASVLATDLRRMPLDNARKNAARFGLAGRIGFVQCDGLAGVSPQAVDTVVCAGMGSDLICRIIGDAPWLRDAGYTLILQPQGTVHDLRRWLQANGFAICRETLVQDGGFLYPVMAVRYGPGAAASPGADYCSRALRESGSPLLGAYLARQRRNLEKSVAGLQKARAEADRQKLGYFAAALAEITQMEQDDGNGT